MIWRKISFDWLINLLQLLIPFSTLPGSKIVGVHCHFDPMTLLDAMQLVKEGLAKANLNVHMMVQPLAYLTPDASKQGFIDLPEFPFSES